MHKLTANELVDRENHAWEELKELLDHGQNKYTYVPAQREVGEDALHRLQVSTKSYLGAVAYETAGIVLDDGWITLLGSGGDQTFGSLTSWNGVADKPCVPALEGMMVVAYDAAGGFSEWIRVSMAVQDMYTILPLTRWNGNRQNWLIRASSTGWLMVIWSSIIRPFAGRVGRTTWYSFR